MTKIIVYAIINLSKTTTLDEREEHNMTHTMSDIIRQLKEYDAMEKELKKEVEALRQEAIAFMTEEGVDEYMTDEGKVTYREVISKRFASTEFKKIHADLYNAFCKQTANMRFTLS